MNGWPLVSIQLGVDLRTVRMTRVLNGKIDQVCEFDIQDCAGTDHLASVIEEFRVHGFDMGSSEFDGATG